jgi:hypothetical protein
MVISQTILILVTATMTCLSGCANAPAQSVFSGSDSGDSPLSCTTTAYSITRSGSCRSSQATLAPFCETPGLGMGEYVLCGVSPNGEMVVFAASSTTMLSNDEGWSFGPSSWVPSIFKLAPLAPADESVCDKIAITTSPDSVPRCGGDGG